MGLRSFLKGKKYRARVYASQEDVGTVPLRSIQTDDLYELNKFVKEATGEELFAWQNVPFTESELGG